MADGGVAILIDNMYLQHAKDDFGIRGRLDPRKYPEMLLREGEIHYKTYIFDALPFFPRSPTQRQRELRAGKKSFFDAIQYYERISVEEGYVRGKTTRCPNCRDEFVVPVQKLVDVKLSVRLVSLGWEKVVEKIVLVSGDGDIKPAVDAIEKTGTIVRLAYAEVGNTRANKKLIQCCPEKHRLTREDIEGVLLEEN